MIFSHSISRRSSVQRVKQFERSLRELPPPGKGAGFHQGSLGVANRAARANICKKELFQKLRAVADRGSRHVPDSAINETINKAYSECGQGLNGAWLRAPRHSRNDDDPSKNIKKLSKDLGITEQELTLLSPVRIPKLDIKKNRQAITLLEALYEPDDLLFLGPQIVRARPNYEIRKSSDWKQCLYCGFKAEFIIPNPLSGCRAQRKDGKWSFRCDAAIKRGSFVVVEFDSISLSLQLAFLTSLPLPIAAITFSGGKSYHAWIDVRVEEEFSDGLNAEEWQTIVIDMLKPQLRKYGADAATFNMSRLSRLAGHWRVDKEEFQRLVYLNPDPRFKAVLT